ncbi:MAG: hypothetical protein QME44_03800 [Thermodesulfobacteriota bacterium]|nr:hypothetical protein [Thermodesulfobacteriota bacterium]
MEKIGYLCIIEEIIKKRVDDTSSMAYHGFSGHFECPSPRLAAGHQTKEIKIGKNIMPRCKKCGTKGWLLKLEEKTGLCLSCNAAFTESGRHFTERIIENVNLIGQPDDPKAMASRCDKIEESAMELILLHKEYSLEPGSELLHLVRRYREIKQEALSKIQK